MGAALCLSACNAPRPGAGSAPTLAPTALPPATATTHVLQAQEAVTRQPPATATTTATPMPGPTTPPPTQPAPTQTPTPTATYATHLVQTEETLLGIAVQYGVTVEGIIAANNLADPNFLELGQALNIPAASSPTPIPVSERDYGYAILGYSAQGRAIELFSFGQGPQSILLVGGIHGGYEWNTVLLAHEIIDYFNGNRDRIPESVTIHIVPVANPDGLYAVTGSAGRFFREQVAAETTVGRFNGNNVDVNRNFGCSWQPTARWGGRNVYPGSGPFSEPEARAIRDLVGTVLPRVVIFWHSAAGGTVATGTCDGSDAGSGELALIYGNAANYQVTPFTAYELSGTASDWVVSQGIPAFAVELITHESTEFGRNLAGVEAILALFGEPQAQEVEAAD